MIYPLIVPVIREDPEFINGACGVVVGWGSRGLGAACPSQTCLTPRKMRASCISQTL